MTWHQTGNKSLPEPILTKLHDASWRYQATMSATFNYTIKTQMKFQIPWPHQHAKPQLWHLWVNKQEFRMKRETTVKQTFSDNIENVAGLDYLQTVKTVIDLILNIQR